MDVAHFSPLIVSKTELPPTALLTGHGQIALFQPSGSARFGVATAFPESAPTSYPEDRHLSGMGLPDGCEGPLSLGSFLRVVGVSALRAEVVGAEPLPVPWTWARSGALPDGEGKSEAAWAREQLDWEHVYMTRSILAQHDAALLEPCAEDGRVLQHSTSDRQRLTPYRCQRRCTCPACGRSYGQGKAAELVSLLGAVLAPGRLVGTAPQVKAWHLVLSNDRRISAYVDELVQAGEVDQLRTVLRHLGEDIQHTLKLIFGAGVAAVIVWHWWASSDPLRGRGHLHAHVTVPNVSVLDGVPVGPLRVQGVLSDAELLDVRALYADRVARHGWIAEAAPDLGAVPLAQNAHVKFSTLLEGGRNSIAHRMRYDARHPVVDVLAVTEPDALRATRNNVDGFYSPDLEGAEIATFRLEDCAAGLAWWARAAAIWQGIQTTRYSGWLQNRPRKALGLVREVEPAPEVPEWSTIGVYTLLNTSASGVRVERWRDGQRYVQEWHGDHVQLLPPAAISSVWGWNDEVRPERLAGPPAAWLAKFAPVPYSPPAPTWEDIARAEAAL